MQGYKRGRRRRRRKPLKPGRIQRFSVFSRVSEDPNNLTGRSPAGILGDNNKERKETVIEPEENQTSIRIALLFMIILMGLFAYLLSGDIALAVASAAIVSVAVLLLHFGRDSQSDS